MPDFDAYIICTTPRSGSTLLCNLLDQTGKAGKPDSHFHSSSLDEWAGYYNIGSSPTDDEADILAQIFVQAVSAGREDTGMFGLRLQRHSFDFFARKLAVLYPGLPSDHARLQTAFGKTLYIHLTRLDKVKQAVSYIKAKRSGLWQMAPDGSELERLSSPKQLTYDADEIRAQSDIMVQMDRDWTRWFTRENITPLVVSYETLASEPIETLRKILNSLGVGIEAADGVAPGVARLADRTNREWVERFRSETT